MLNTTNASQRTSRILTFAPKGQMPIADDFWERTDWQRVWLQTQSRAWRTLALVPGDEHTSTLPLATLIAKLAFDHGEAIHVADLRRLKLKHVDAFLDGIHWDEKHGDRIIFATRSVSANLATVPIARAADCSILCVSLGATRLDNARATIEQIGVDHFAGTVLVKAAADSPKSSRREQALLR